MKGFEIPEGVSDELFKEYKIKENIVKEIDKIFKKFGYRKVSTPTIEYYDIFSTIKSTVLKDEMFKLIDKSGEILTLRPDATIPIARIIAKNYKKDKGNYKVCYSTQVFKMKSETKRENTQIGIEYFGNANSEADGEVIVSAIESLLKCGMNFKIELGNARFYKALLDSTNIEDKDKKELKSLIEYKNFVEVRSYVENLDIKKDIKDAIIAIPSLYGKFEDTIKEAEKFVLNTDMKEALEELKEIYDFIKDYEYNKYVSLDLGLINNLEYYTGMMFKGYIEGYGDRVLSGGRYDNLTHYYGETIPATGFSISVDELINAITNKKEIIDDSFFKIDYKINYKVENRKKAIQKAKELRAQNYIVELERIKEFPENKLENIKNIINI